MCLHARIRFAVLAILLLTPTFVEADALCTLCFSIFRSPGGADSGGAGMFRMRGCPCCQPEDCKTAAKRAQGLRDRYESIRGRYEKLNQEIAGLRSSGAAIPQEKIAEQANMNFQLGQLESQYAILNAECPKEVPGDNIWDGLYGGPVENSPVTGEGGAKREIHAAKQMADSYDRLAQSEQKQLEVIVGFLNTSAAGFAPPASGYNGERAKVTRGYRAVADAYRKEATFLLQGAAAKPDPKVDLEKRLAPTFPETKVPRKGEAHHQNAGIAARARLEANQYIFAYLQARAMYRQAIANGNQDAAKMHARSAIEFAWQAQGYGKWAADYQHQSDVVHQKLLDAALAKADKSGVPLADLLKRFQSQVKESGVPAPLRDAMTGARATPEELAATKERMLAWTPETVDRVLKERRARIARGPEVPDAWTIDTQFTATRSWYHTQVKK